MIHMEYYLIVSAIMFFAGIYGVDTECYGYQLRSIQPFPFPRRNGRVFLCPVLHCHLGSRNGSSYRDYDQYLS